jgi:hypothetical protein
MVMKYSFNSVSIAERLWSIETTGCAIGAPSPDYVSIAGDLWPNTIEARLST